VLSFVAVAPAFPQERGWKRSVRLTLRNNMLFFPEKTHMPSANIKIIANPSQTGLKSRVLFGAQALACPALKPHHSPPISAAIKPNQTKSCQIAPKK
jgi:hypothetical protein